MEAVVEDGEVQSKGGGEKVVEDQPSPRQPPDAKSSPTSASSQEGSIERGLAADQEGTKFGPSAESWLDGIHKPDSFITLASPSYRFEAELHRCSESGFQSIITTGSSMPSPTLTLGCDEAGGEFGTGEDCEGDYESEQPKRDVRRPMNAFLIFCKRHRSIVRAKYPDKDNRSVTKILGDLWAHLSTDEKAVYTKLAKQYKDAFMKANPGYTWHNTQKLPQPAKMATRGPTLVRPPRSLSASDCLDISAQAQAKKSAGLVVGVGSCASAGHVEEDGSGIAGLNLLLMVGEKAQAQPEVTAIKRKLPIPELTVANSLLQLAEIASENRLLLEGPVLSGTPPKKRARHYSYSEFGYSDISQKPLPVSTLLITPEANSALNAAKPSPSPLPTHMNYQSGVSPSGLTSQLGVSPYSVTSQSVTSSYGVTSQSGVSLFSVTSQSGTSPYGVTKQSGVSPFGVTSQSGTSPYGVTSQSGLLLSMPVAEQPPTGGVVGSWERLKSMATASMKNAGLSVGQTLPGLLSSDIGIPPKKKFTKLQTLAQDHSLVAAAGLAASVISVTSTPGAHTSPVVLASPGVQAMTPVAGMAARGASSAEPAQIPALQPGNDDFSDQNDNAIYKCGKRVVDHIMDRLHYTGGNNGTARHEGGVGSLPSSLENPSLGDKVIAADLSGWEKVQERLVGSSVGKLVSETVQKPQNLVDKVIKEAYNIDVGQSAQTADAVLSMPVPSAPSGSKLPSVHLAGPLGPALSCGHAAPPTDDLTPSSILTTLSFKPVRLEPATQPILSIVEPSVPRVASLTEVVGAGDGTGALRMAASSFVRDLAAAAVRGPPSAAGKSLFVSREKAASAASSASAASAAAVPWYTNLGQPEKTCKSPVASAPVPHPENETRVDVEQSSASFAVSGVAATEHKEHNSDFGGHDDEENSQPLRKSLRPNRGQRYNQLIREGIIQPCKDRLAAHRQEPVQSQLEPEPAPEPPAMYAEDSQEEGEDKSTEDRSRVTLKRSISESDTSGNNEEKRYCTGDFDLEAKIHALPPCSLEVMRRRQARKRSDSESKKSCSSSSLSQGAPLSPVLSTHLTALAKEEVKGEDPTIQATVKTSSFSLSSAVGAETQATTTPAPAVTEADRSVLVIGLVPPVLCSTKPAATVALAPSTDSEFRTGSQKRKMRKSSIRKVSNDGTDAGIASTLPRVRDKTLSSSPVLHPLPKQPPPSSILSHHAQSSDLLQIADRLTTTQSNDLLSLSFPSSVPPLAAGTELSPHRAVTDSVSVVGVGAVKPSQAGRLPSPVSAVPLVSAGVASLCSSSVVCTSAVGHGVSVGSGVGSRTVSQAHPSRGHLSDLAAEPGLKSSPSITTKSSTAEASWDSKNIRSEEAGTTQTLGAPLPAAFTEDSAAAFLSETASSPAGITASLSRATETGKSTASPPVGAADCASAKPAAVKTESITVFDKLTQLIKEEINRGDDDDRIVPGVEAMGATARAGAVKVERSAASCPECDRSRPNLVADAAVKVEKGNSNVNCFTMFRHVKTEDQDCKTCMPVSCPMADDKQTASLVRLTHPAPDHQTFLSQIWLGSVNPEDRKPSCWDSEGTIGTYHEKKTVLVPELSKPARLMLDQVATARAPEIYHPAVTVPLTEASRSRIFITVTTAGYQTSNQASPPLSVVNSTESTCVTNVSKSVALDPVVSSSSTICQGYLAGYSSSASEVWNAASKLPDPSTTDTRQEGDEDDKRKKREGLHFTLDCVSSARVEEKDVEEMKGVDLEEGVLRTIPGSPMAVVHS